MIYRMIALGLMAMFFVLYALYMRSKLNQAPQTERGKWTTAINTLCLAAVAVCIIGIVYGNAMLGYTGRGILLKVFGTYLGLLANILMVSVLFGVFKDKSKSVFICSRYPVTLSADILFLGILLMYFHIVLLVFVLAVIIVLHMDILRKERAAAEEEKSEKERAACGKARRYIGYGPWTYEKVKCFIYVLAAYFSVCYYVTCVAYAGIYLSFVWIWLLLAAFSCVRIVMLTDAIRHDETGEERRFRLPKIVRVLYHVFFVLAATVFFYVEANVVISMNMEPEEGLDHVIVLGAGLRADNPTRPLYLRIQKAYNYAKRNPDTILIASGGKGNDEIASEASVIKRYLVDMGLSEDRIIMEENSTSTIENLRYSAEILGEHTDKVGIVSNGFHLYRVKLIAKHEGYGEIIGIPAQTLFPVGIHYVVREFFGVVQLAMQDIF